jgi:hypothetical protein
MIRYEEARIGKRERKKERKKKDNALSKNISFLIFISM